MNDFEEIQKHTEELNLALDFLKEGLITEEELETQFEKTLALIEAVKNGVIDCITSDHNPIDIESDNNCQNYNSNP